jgi:hypothetical protein
MFEGKGRPLTENGLHAARRALGIDLPTLWTVMTVETRGCGFLPSRRPVILFERHIFHQRTGGRFDTRAPDLSNPRAGGYGADGEHQHERLKRAVALDRRAALESTSWGLGQVMGFNANIAGYRSVETMVRAMMLGEDSQLKAMMGYIQSERLAAMLKRRDWAGFAYRYNGPEYQRNRYDERLALAHARYSAGPLPSLAVRAAQLYLTVLGYDPRGVDGWYGSNTQKAVQQFQQTQGMAVTGRLDSATLTALARVARKV